MLRWILVLSLVLAATVWTLDATSDDSTDGATAPEARADDGSATPLRVQRPATAGSGTAGSGTAGSGTAGSGTAGSGEAVEVRRPASLDRPAVPTAKKALAAAGVDEGAARPAGAEAGAPGGGLVAQASTLLAQGRKAEAVALLRTGVDQVGDPAQRGAAALLLAAHANEPLEQREMVGLAIRVGAVKGAQWDQVGELLRRLGRNPRASLYDGLDVVNYTVRPGDSLWKLCRSTLPDEHGVKTSAGLLRMVNGMSGDGLHPGQTLLVPKETLSIHVDRVEHGLVLWLGELPLVAYRIGLGKEGRTPTGEFVVQVKQENPDWYKNGRRVPFGDPENVLGTRWMGFENSPGAMGYGIHGTDAPESIGKDESMGCVRMRNHEVEELFELVPRGTIVSIP